MGIRKNTVFAIVNKSHPFQDEVQSTSTFTVMNQHQINCIRQQQQQQKDIKNQQQQKKDSKTKLWLNAPSTETPSTYDQNKFVVF